MRLLTSVLLLLPAFAYYQLTDSSYATYFDSTNAPVIIELKDSPALYAFPSNSSSFSVWIRLFEIPASPLSLVTFNEGSNVLLDVSMLKDGSFKATAKLSDATNVVATVAPTDGTTPQWIYVAAVTCRQVSDPTLTLAVSTKTNLFSIESTASSPFPYFLPADSFVTIGGTSTYSIKVRLTQGQFTNLLSMIDLCLAVPSFSDVTISRNYNLICSSSDGPGDKSCLDYIQLRDQIKANPTMGVVQEWASDDPIMRDRNLISNSYSFTGWFYLTDLSQPRYNLFQTVITDSGTDYRLLAIYVNNAPSFTFSTDTDSTSNQSQDMSLTVRYIQISPVNTWYFVGISVTNGLLSFCYAVYSDPAATCSSLALTGAAWTFGASSANWIRIGDSSLALPTGQMIDLRYYFNSAKTTAELAVLFTGRKAVLPTGCLTVTSLFDCNACNNGFYLDGTICKLTCPRGYTASSGTCVASGLSYVRFRFVAVAPMIVDADSTGFYALSGDTLTYLPAFETSDPIPSLKRGYHFNGDQFLYLPPDIDTPGTPVVFSVSPTISAWIRREPSGDSVVYSKQIADKNMFTLLINSLGQVQFSGGAPTITYAHPRIIPVDTWTYIGLKLVYNSNIGKTTLTFYYNGVADASVVTQTFCMKDANLAATQFIGVAYIGDAFSNKFMGFIWEVAIDNNGGHLNNFSSAGCPADEAFCLSTCSLIQEPTSCAPCQGGCTNGCQRTTDCGLCVDVLCDICSSNLIDVCTTCVPHATRTKQCNCDSGYFKSDRDCIECSGQCLECVNSSTLGCSSCGANAVLAGSAPNSCKCVSGFRRETANGPCMKCVNYFAPSDLKAYIDSTFMKLIVTFPLAVLSSSAQSCALIFDPASLAKLGNSPLCLWASDNKSLTVQLGANYLLRTETITLIATNIGSVEGDCTAVQQVLAVEVTYESPRIPPTAVISAPSTYSPPCESLLRLSGSRSTGLTGQTGLYKWKLTLMPSQQEIDTYKTYAAANVDVSIPSSLLSGDSLNATLFVSDPFNTEGVSSLVVMLTRDNALVVSFDAVSPVQTVRTRPVKIESSCRFTCPVPDIQFEYQWEQLSGPTVDFNSLPSYLYIKPGKLIPSRTYQFRLNAIGGEIRGSANITIQVSPSPLKVVLNRGDGQHEAGSDLVLNATDSSDPDNLLSQLKYHWVCSEGTATCKDKDGNGLVLNSIGILIITSNKLRVNAKYQFALTVSVGTRNKNAKIAIEIVSPVNLDIKISAEQVRLPSGSDKVVNPNIKSNDKVTFLWTQISGATISISTPSNVPWMKIPGSQVTSGMSFTFALTITMKSGSLMQYLTSSANLSPAFGRVTVNQTIGETFVDNFWFQAPGWDDPDGTDYPLTYQYGIVPPGELPRYLTSEKLSYDFISYFYPGLLTFTVKVCDTLQGCTLANIQITVTTPKPRQLQIASLAVSKKKFATEVKTISKIPIVIMNYAKLLTTSVDAELYGMMFNASQTFVASMPYIDNAYFANQLTCCAYMLNLTHLMNSTRIKNMSDFVTGSIARMVEKLNNDNLNTVLGLYTGLKAKSELTSEIKKFYAIMYAYLSLLPGDIPTTIKSSNLNVTATSTIATDSKSLNIIANNVGLQFPSTFLTDMNIASGTKCDIRVEVYNNIGETTPTIAVSLTRSGSFDGYNLRSTQPQSLTPSGLNSPVNLTVPVNKLIPGIPYTAIAQAENSVKWSTAGVNLAIISYVSAIISAYHFSSFKIVPKEMIPIEFAEWPVLAVMPETSCDETYTPIIFADLQIVFLILCYVAVELYRKNKLQVIEVPPKNCDVKSEHENLKVPPKCIDQIESSHNPETRRIPQWPLEFNLVFGFISSSHSVVRLLMAIAVFQCENITLGVANKIRFDDWEADIDPVIDSWGGFDFLCCVSALVIGQIFGWILLIAFFQIKVRSISYLRAFTAIVVVLSIMMNSALMWMSTTGCDGVLNRWTAEAIAVMIAELVTVNWLSTMISKYAIYVFRQPEVISRRSST